MTFKKTYASPRLIVRQLEPATFAGNYDPVGYKTSDGQSYTP